MDGGAEKRAHLTGGGFEVEGLPRQRHSREDVDDEADVKVEEPEAAGNLSHIGHEDVVRFAGSKSLSAGRG